MFYPKLFSKVIYPLYEQGFAKRGTVKYINEYAKNLTLNKVKLEEIQFNKLKKLLSHANNTVPYYNQLWKDIGFIPEDLNAVSELRILPVVTKDIISENYDDFISSKYRGKNRSKSTGGSTGTPFKYEFNNESDERRQAVMWRGYGWLGAGLGEKTLHLWGGHIKPVKRLQSIKESLYHKFYNRMMLNTFHMSNDNMEYYINKINNYKPTAIIAYVNPLFLLAKYILEHNINIYAPKSIITGAEPLYEFQRVVVEKAFNTTVYSTYGCREFMLIGAECKEQDGYHLNIDHLVVEVLSDDAQESAEGDIVITDLHNYGMPLIRYKNGDRGVLGKEACKCNNPLPLLKSVNGRKLDMIKTADGRSLAGEFFPHLFKDYVFIKRFQVVQNTIDSVDISIVPDSVLTTNNIDELKACITPFLGDEITVNINSVDDIPLTVSGKHRVTISNIGK